MHKQGRWLRLLPAAAGALVVLLVLFGLFILARMFLTSPPHQTERKVQSIAVVQAPPPPPPPPPETPPPPKMEESIPEPEPVEEPAPLDDMPEVSSDPIGPLGLDTEGVGSGDGFGLVGKRGGQSLIDRAPFQWYAETLSAELSALLADSDELRRSSYAVMVRIWINAQGQITRAELRQSTGNARLDQLLVGALSAGSTPVEPPPVTMPQPVVVRISSRT